MDISEHYLREYKKAFKLFDENGDGMITSAELKQVCNSLGDSLSISEVQEMMKSVDENNDGVISFDEFVKYLDKYLTDDEVVETFKYFDKNNDGFITENELDQVMSELTNFPEDNSIDTIRAMMKEADTDGDGKISLEEFKKVVQEK